jgi:hypothetical protein
MNPKKAGCCVLTCIVFALAGAGCARQEAGPVIDKPVDHITFKSFRGTKSGSPKEMVIYASQLLSSSNSKSSIDKEDGLLVLYLILIGAEPDDELDRIITEAVEKAVDDPDEEAARAARETLEKVQAEIDRGPKRKIVFQNHPIDDLKLDEAGREKLVAKIKAKVAPAVFSADQGTSIEAREDRLIVTHTRQVQLVIWEYLKNLR